MEQILPSEFDICAAIAKSGLFDVNYYLAANPDVAASALDPILHYVRYGEKEGRNPSRGFILESYAPLYRKNTNILYQHIQKLGGIDAGIYKGGMGAKE